MLCSFDGWDPMGNCNALGEQEIEYISNPTVDSCRHWDVISGVGEALSSQEKYNNEDVECMTNVIEFLLCSFDGC